MHKKKALLITTVSGFVPQFEMNNVRLLQEMGYEVHYAANYRTPSYGNDNRRLDGTGIVRHQIDFVRSPFRLANIKVYGQLLRLMRRERFDLVHCHTPMGSVMARLAARASHTGPVIYTAHGFHFFRGAPLVNWICYYPMERYLSGYTDQLICINREDYIRAKRMLHAGRISYVPGEGLDAGRIVEMSPEEIQEKKKKLGIPKDSIVFLSVGELIKRKNHKTVLQAIAKLRMPEIKYVICGQGKLDTYLRGLAERLGISEQIVFMGYREDIMEIYPIADVFLFPSRQEGLPMALLEAMANGLPVICTDIRGNRDLMGKVLRREGVLKYCAGGIMADACQATDGFGRAMEEMLEMRACWRKFGEMNRKRSGRFSQEESIRRMRIIYQRMGNNRTGGR